MNFDLEELKKNHNTSYLAGILERLNKEEAEVKDMLAKDENLKEMVDGELKNIEEQRNKKFKNRNFCRYRFFEA